jgi:hypothetical protein
MSLAENPVQWAMEQIKVIIPNKEFFKSVKLYNRHVQHAGRDYCRIYIEVEMHDSSNILGKHIHNVWNDGEKQELTEREKIASSIDNIIFYNGCYCYFRTNCYDRVDDVSELHYDWIIELFRAHKCDDILEIERYKREYEFE